MATQVLKTIGTTGRDHTTLVLWESNNQADIVAADENHVAEMYDDSVFTAGVDIMGWTTDATRDIRITVASGQRHDGTVNSGVRINDTSGDTILIRENFVCIEWLALASTGSDFVIRDLSTSGAGTILIQNNVVTSTDVSGSGALIHGTSADITTNVYNNIVYGGRIGIECNGTMNVKNCTVFGAANRGIYRAVGTMTVSNSISMGNGANLDFNGTMTQDHNMSSDGTASGTGSLINKTTTDQFVDIGSGTEDLHIKTGADAIDAGSDLGAVANIDIDESDRDSLGVTWDIGAHELITALSATGLLDGKITIKDSVSNLLDGKVQVKDITTNLLDGKIIVANISTEILDGKVVIKDSSTLLLDGKIQVKDKTTNLLDGKVQVKDIVTNLLDGKIIITTTTTSSNLLDGKVVIKSITTNNLDGKLQVKDKTISLLDGKVVVESSSTGLLDGKVIIKDAVINLLDGKVQIKDIATGLLDGKIIVSSGQLDKNNQLILDSFGGKCTQLGNSKINTWSTSTRPTGVLGLIGFNTTTDKIEVFDGAVYKSVSLI